MNTKQKALALARGSHQRALIEGRATIGCASLSGKAKQYMMRYEQSAWTLIERLRANGIPLHIEYGPRGGIYSAHLVIDAEEPECQN